MVSDFFFQQHFSFFIVGLFFVSFGVVCAVSVWHVNQNIVAGAWFVVRFASLQIIILEKHVENSAKRLRRAFLVIFFVFIRLVCSRRELCRA